MILLLADSWLAAESYLNWPQFFLSLQLETYFHASSAAAADGER